jgi:hypothetical protein
MSLHQISGRAHNRPFVLLPSRPPGREKVLVQHDEGVVRKN